MPTMAASISTWAPPPPLPPPPPGPLDPPPEGDPGPAAPGPAAAFLAKLEELETPVTNIAKATATRTVRFVIGTSLFETICLAPFRRAQRMVTGWFSECGATRTKKAPRLASAEPMDARGLGGLSRARAVNAGRSEKFHTFRTMTAQTIPAAFSHGDRGAVIPQRNVCDRLRVARSIHPLFQRGNSYGRRFGRTDSGGQSARQGIRRGGSRLPRLAA